MPSFHRVPHIFITEAAHWTCENLEKYNGISLNLFHMFYVSEIMKENKHLKHLLRADCWNSLFSPLKTSSLSITVSKHKEQYLK